MTWLDRAPLPIPVPRIAAELADASHPFGRLANSLKQELFSKERGLEWCVGAASYGASRTLEAFSVKDVKSNSTNDTEIGIQLSYCDNALNASGVVARYAADWRIRIDPSRNLVTEATCLENLVRQ